MQIKVGVMEIYKYSVLHGDVELTNMTVTTVFVFLFNFVFFSHKNIFMSQRIKYDL